MSKPKQFSQKVIGIKAPEATFTVTDRDAIIYALGIGFSQDPMKQQDYQYTYELGDSFTVFPTIAPCITKFDIVGPLMQSELVPEFSPFMILHAESRQEMIKPKIQNGATYVSRQELVDIVDKGKNALLLFRIKTFEKKDGKEELAFINDLTMMIRGKGGFGYKGKGQFHNIPKIPEEKPDYVLNDSSFPGQAFLYRLSGDINPLHVDPNISAMQNFERPIIHGLASYGIVARAIVQGILNNDSSLMKSYHCRFVGHVFPGEKYQIQVWRRGNKLIFRANVVERKTQAIIGQMQIREQAKL